MRILHINCNYMTTSLHQTMIEHLDALTDNIVFCPIRRNQTTTTIANNNVVVSECFTNLDRLMYFKKQRQIQNELEIKVNVKSFDLIHAYTLLTDGNVAYSMNKKYGIPFIVAVRDTDMNVFFKQKPYLIGRALRIMEKASYIIFLSEAYRDRMLQKYIPKKDRKKYEEKMIIIPNGIDDYWLDHAYVERDIEKTLRRIEDKKIKLICVGQIIKRKNIPMIQSALQELCGEGWDVHLDVIGKGLDKKELLKITSDSKTTYIEPMKKEMLIEKYRENDIFVLASKTETFGLVYAEAISQGLPVIYTQGQGFDGQFAEGEVGFHCRSDSSSNIKEQIKKICSDYTSISARCVELSKRYRWSKIVDRYSNIYTNIVKLSS